MKTLGLKNINLLTQEQYSGITEPAEDELWAVEFDKDVIGIPDYSAGVSKTGTWVAEYSGVYKIRFGGVANGTVGWFTVDGQPFYGRTYNQEEQQTISAVIGKGSTVILSSANQEAIFYPFKE